MGKEDNEYTLGLLAIFHPLSSGLTINAASYASGHNPTMYLMRNTHWKYCFKSNPP